VSADAALGQFIKIPAIDLSTTHSVTIAFWSKRTYSTVGGHTLLESTPNYGQSTTGFALFPDDSACGGIEAVIKGDAGETANCYGQPTSGMWHHITLVFDKTQSAGNQVALYLDGALQNPTRSLAASTNTNDFGNNPIYVFSRAGTTMFDSGRVEDLRVYAAALTSSQVQQLYAAGNGVVSKDLVTWVDGNGKMTTPSFTTSANNELLVAFVAYDGPPSFSETASVTGGGLIWTLRARSNKQLGTSEIWSATAPTAPFTATVSSQPAASGSWHGSLTVVGFTNASGTGRVGQNSASSGAPDVALANVAASSWVFAVGNDWDNSVARTPVSGQVLVHQRVDTVVGDTYWVQSTAAPTTATGTVTIHDSAPTSDRWNYAAIEIVSALNPQGTLAAAPTSVNFGNVNINTTASQTVTVTNTGNASLTVNAVSVAGTGFSLGTVATPFTLAAGATQQLTVSFAPTATGAVTGSVSVSSNASNPNLTVPLSGAGTTPGTLSPSPSSVSFGNVNLGSSASQTITLTNSGTGSVTVSSLSVSGAGFSLGTVSTPFTLAGGSTKQLTATFAPTTTGAASGTVSVVSNATNANLTIPLSGTGVSQGTLTASPTPLSFGKVNIYSSATQTVTLSNTGTASVTVSSVGVSGTGFSLATVATPFTLAVGATQTLTVTFAPTVAGAANGSVTVTSNGSNPNLAIPLIGTGTTPGPLTATPSSLSFGNVTINTSSSLSVTLTNTGTGSVTVSALSISGSGFSLAVVTTPFTMVAGSTTTLIAYFMPTVAGTASGTITVTSNATNPTLSVALSGTGATPSQHQVTLSWTASTSQVAGYNVYRATNANGPFSVLNTSLISATTYVDQAVTSGTTYYYYATAVDTQGNESLASNQAAATVP
jgi:hypothetical protein